MTIHALEHEDPLDLEHVRKYPTAHQRCGTEFLVIFIILSILMFSLLAGQSLLVSIVGRIALVPVIASIAYELLRFGARHRDRAVIRWLYLPGIWLQGITTRQPDDSMIEVAIASMREALAANGEEPPAGSWDPPRRPIPMGANKKGVNEQESTPDQLVAVTLEARLDTLEQRLTEIETEWSRPEVAADPERRRDLGREQSQIEPIVGTYRRLRDVRESLRGCARGRIGSGVARARAGRDRPGRARRAGADRDSCGFSCCRAIRTTRRTSSSRSAPAPAARRPRFSARSCSACTSATPSAGAGRRS